MARILLTGATGYIGGRLLGVLERAGHEVVCLARNPAHLAGRLGPRSRVVQGDLLDRASLDAAFHGVEIAYFLVHSMGDASGFEAREIASATHFADAARHAGVRRIIYLGGLGDSHADLSPHLRSRQHVGRILRDSGVLTIELQASIVIGSGSLSFEMIRALSEHLPVMITPRWVSVLAQPIGIQDLIAYLVQAIDVDVPASTVVEIGGADQLSYAALMREYMRQRRLKRLMIPVPVLTPRLSSLWLGLVTPVYARVGRKLVESIRHPTVVRSPLAAQLFRVKPGTAAEAIRAALENEDREFAETRWSDAMSSAGVQPGYGGVRFGQRLVDRRSIQAAASPQACFDAVQSIGGTNGWFTYNWLWRMRGFLDLLVGGVGMRRGRPDRALRVGDALDFWRVEACESPRLLRLRAEMRLPGRAWLEFEIAPAGEGTTTITQTALFDPVGLGGLAYWYSVYPAHGLVFGSMIRALAARAEASTLAPATPVSTPAASAPRS